MGGGGGLADIGQGQGYLGEFLDTALLSLHLNAVLKYAELLLT